MRLDRRQKRELFVTLVEALLMLGAVLIVLSWLAEWLFP